MSEYSIAPCYDLLLYPFVHKLRTKILSHCVAEGYSSILDVCCGTGDQLKLLKRNGFDVVGIDISSDMLQVSQRGKYAPDCRFQDASSMNFEDSTFPMAMITFALHEKEADIAASILREMIRVVQAEGHILLIDFHFQEQSSWLSRLIITLIERKAGGAHYSNFRNFIARGGILSLINSEPLEIQRIEYSGMGSIAMYVLKNRK